MFAPRWIAMVDLDALPTELAAPVWPGELTCRFLSVRVLVRLHGAPLGLVECPLVDGALSGDHLRYVIDRDLSEARARHEAGCRGPEECPNWGPVPVDWPVVSVVVCTHERPASLKACLRSLSTLAYPSLEIVIVDNAPRTSETRDVVAAAGDPRIRYTCAEIPGLSVARNHGVAEAKGEIVAFTDDDVVVDPRWLEGLVRGFGRRPDIGMVTGLILAAELESQAQAFFERKVTWGAVLNPRQFSITNPPSDEVMTAYNCGMVGAGANFAARRDLLLRVGPFDEALGAGAPSRGGEDLDYFRRILLDGKAIAYEPASLVWHYHRRELATLRKQMIGYGSGLTAFGFKQLLDPDKRWAALRDLPRALVRFAVHGTSNPGAHARFVDAGPLPRGLWWLEMKGMFQGPVLYLRGRSAVAERRKQASAAKQ